MTSVLWIDHIVSTVESKKTHGLWLRQRVGVGVMRRLTKQQIENSCGPKSLPVLAAFFFFLNKPTFTSRSQ